MPCSYTGHRRWYDWSIALRLGDSAPRICAGGVRLPYRKITDRGFVAVRAEPNARPSPTKPQYVCRDIVRTPSRILSSSHSPHRLRYETNRPILRKLPSPFLVLSGNPQYEFPCSVISYLGCDLCSLFAIETFMTGKRLVNVFGEGVPHGQVYIEGGKTRWNQAH